MTLALFTLCPAARAQTYILSVEDATPLDNFTPPFESEWGTLVEWEQEDTDFPVDDDKDLVDIGFTFNFGGLNYTKVRVLSNGALHFGADQGFHKDSNNEELPVTTAVDGPGFEEPADGIIAPYWSNLNPASGGGVYYGTLGSEPDRRFVASWVDVSSNNPSRAATFQVVLYERGEIRFRYGRSKVTGAGATIGLEVNDTDFVQHSFSSARSISEDRDLVFTRLPYFALAHSGTTYTCLGAEVTLTAHSRSGGVDTAYTGTATLSTSSGGGTWSVASGNGELSPLGGGSATYAFDASDGGSVTLLLQHPFAATVDIDVTDVVDGSRRELTLVDPPLEVRGAAVVRTFADSFPDNSFSASTGTQAWTGDWTEVDPGGGGPDGGNVWAQNNALYIGNGLDAGDESSVAREADLSTFTKAVLTFDYATTNGVDPEDSLKVEVSADGGVSWTLLEDFMGFSGATSGSRQYTITPYMALNTRIRFRLVDGSKGGNGRFSIDNVEIDVGSPCVQTDHFAILHDGSAVTCQAEPVVIAAHDGTDGVDTGYEGTITLSTSSARGDWSVIVGAGSLTNQGNGSATYTFDTGDNGQVTLALANTFVETLNIDVTDGSVGEAADEDPDLVYAETGFNFLADGAASSIGTQIANKPSDLAPGAQVLELQAIETNAETGQCEAALVGVQDIELAFECIDPAGCSGDQLHVNGTGVPGNANGSPVSFTGVSLDFGPDTDSTAALVLSYPDAGLLRVHARKALLLDDGSASGNTMLGASNAFVVRPFGFDVDFSDDRESNGTSGVSYAADATGSVFSKAGSAFSTTVTAYAWQAADDVDADGVPDVGANLTDNLVTEQFGAEASAPVVVLSPVLVAPSGGALGSLGGSSVSGFSAGVATTSLTYSEVGIIDINAALANYLGGAQSVTGAVEQVGRFIPARFALSYSTLALRDGPDSSWTCSFTYMDQLFGFATDPVFTLHALNTAGTATLNYGGDFWRFGPGPYLANRSYTDASGSGVTLDAPLLGLVSLSGTTDFTDGEGSLTLSDEVFSYLRATAPQEPFAGSINFRLAGIDLVDADGVCYHPSDVSCNTGDASMNVPQDLVVDGIGTVQVRFGRMRLENALGSELMPVSPPMLVEIYQGGGFQTHIADTCTTITIGAIDLVNDVQDPALGTPNISVGAGTSTATIGSSPPSAGEFELAFSAPGAGNTGFTDLSFDLSIITGADLEWLRYDWDGDGSHDDDPTARASFGIYHGMPRLIFVREPWR